MKEIRMTKLELSNSVCDRLKALGFKIALADIKGLDRETKQKAVGVLDAAQEEIRQILQWPSLERQPPDKRRDM
jgi:hypothetical protein